MDELTRYNIIEAPLPDRLRLRDLIGGFCSVLCVVTPAMCVVFVLLGWPFLRSLQTAFLWAYVTASAVIAIVWLIPIFSFVSESLIRQRIYAGALERVTLYWNATYGIAVFLIAQPLLLANPVTHHFLAQREIRGFTHATNYQLLSIVGGFVLAWLVRLVILSLSQERPARAVFADLSAPQAPTIEEKIVDAYEPLKVPKWPMSS